MGVRRGKGDAAIAVVIGGGGDVVVHPPRHGDGDDAPIVTRFAKARGLSASRLLMPMSFAASLGTTLRW
jgi:hypothetical protein